MPFAPKTISERRGIIRRTVEKAAATTDERLINSYEERGWKTRAGRKDKLNEEREDECKTREVL